MSVWIPVLAIVLFWPSSWPSWLGWEKEGCFLISEQENNNELASTVHCMSFLFLNQEQQRCLQNERGIRKGNLNSKHKRYAFLGISHYDRTVH